MDLLPRERRLLPRHWKWIIERGFEVAVRCDNPTFRNDRRPLGGIFCGWNGINNEVPLKECQCTLADTLTWEISQALNASCGKPQSALEGGAYVVRRTQVGCWHRSASEYFRWVRCDSVWVEAAFPGWRILFMRFDDPRENQIFKTAQQAIECVGLTADPCECTPAQVLTREIEEALALEEALP